jgi:hypothetical protein
MKKEYNVVTDERGNTVIWYEENGFRVSFFADEANPDYQAYLKRDEAEHFTPIVVNEAETI